MGVLFEQVAKRECPGRFIIGGLLIDEESEEAVEGEARIVGCRGISCKQCWSNEDERLTKEAEQHV